MWVTDMVSNYSMIVYMLYDFTTGLHYCAIVFVQQSCSHEQTTEFVTNCCYVLFLQVGVVPDGVASLTHHPVGKRCYTVITAVLRRMAVLVAKLLLMAVVVIYEVLV